MRRPRTKADDSCTPAYWARVDRPREGWIEGWHTRLTVEEGAATLQRIKQERDHDEAEFQRVVAQLSCADMEECLHSLRRLKQEQRYLEAELQRVNARLKRAVDKLSAAELEDLHSRNNNPGKVHVEHDKLDSIADGFTLMRKILREINALAAQANEASTAAIRCGATQAQVHAAALT